MITTDFYNLRTGVSFSCINFCGKENNIPLYPSTDRWYKYDKFFVKFSQTDGYLALGYTACGQYVAYNYGTLMSVNQNCCYKPF